MGGTGVETTASGNTITISSTVEELTITGNDGIPISPSMDNWNIVGSGNVTTEGAGSTLTAHLTGITQFNTLVGEAGNTIGNVSPGTSGFLLTSNGPGAPPTYQIPATHGDVVGPVSSTDNALVRWDGTTGKLIQNGVITEDDTGNLSIVASVSGGTLSSTINNTSNTASSKAVSQIRVAGSSADDPLLHFVVTGNTNWAMGIDNSASDGFALSPNATIGTANAIQITTAGEINYPSQPAFQARLSASTANDKTGAGAAYTIIPDTVTFDQNSDYNNTTGVFTAPVTGRYALNGRASYANVVLANSYTLNIVTSNRQYGNTIGTVVLNNFRHTTSDFSDMDVGDTATLQILVNGESGDTVGLVGSATNAVTYFAGYLEC